VQPFGSWEAHVRYWLGQDPFQQSRQVYLVKYEALRLEPLRVLDGLLRWLGEEVDCEVISEAVTNNTVEKMRTKEYQEAAGKHFSQAKNPQFRFVDQGTTTGWHERLNAEQRTAMEGQFGPLLRRLDYPLSMRKC
jgi:hypothetical protein